MSEGPPDHIAINHDDYHAKHIGRMADGRQFLLTTPFEPAIGGRTGCEYVALYTFDGGGGLIDAKIESFGPRDRVKHEDISARYESMLASLGAVSFDRIVVAPFQVERFGSSFGLILREPEEEGAVWAVEMQPGNSMAFFEPWDSGDYDT